MTKSSPEAKIKVGENGPYEVSGNVPISRQTIRADASGGSQSWQEGEKFAAKRTAYLCRCGHSKNKPYCDGTHATINFNGEETASRKSYLRQAQEIAGPTMVLTDVEDLCAFGRFCDPNGGVWNQVQQAEDPEVKSTFIRQTGDCPAGRLVAWDRSTQRPHEPKLPVSIGLIEDPVEQCSGPLWVRGGIAIESADGFQYEVRNRVALCRCGASSNKPFCDGSHASITFRDDR